jgi:predicted amidohydrolase YtcJ
MPIVIRGGMLIDGTGAPPRSGMAVAIDGVRLRAVGREEDLAPLIKAEATQVIDAGGKWVLPGLINTHEHLFFRDIVGPARETRAKGPFTMPSTASATL